MVKTKITPIYPAEAFKNNISATVVLHATIDSKSVVEAVHVISRPAPPEQATLDAVRQWTFRPYPLNNRPIKIETTIDVVIPPSR
jgi:protein TonB